MSDPFYANKLYPLQDRILSLVGATQTGFYLTGGTALSRVYLEHRYSDGMDFFVNRAKDFQTQVNQILSILKASGFGFDVGARADDFIRIFLQKDDLRLKIDFVNDVEAHFGGLKKSDIFIRVDGWRNILSNKVCALSRREAKDFADIAFIAQTYAFDWEEIIQEAREKDLWVEPIAVSKLFNEFPADLMRAVKWITPVDYRQLDETIKTIGKDILLGRSNSLKP